MTQRCLLTGGTSHPEEVPRLERPGISATVRPNRRLSHPSSRVTPISLKERRRNGSQHVGVHHPLRRERRGLPGGPARTDLPPEVRRRPHLPKPRRPAC
ncbi:hypothetical protein SCOCK_300061 [Actinacidiphila cocklensis]|uniref:Uncharacterized protein n=1 Tax=Actinacidiphila cocklensis TaxID=887465 RepID=A0A9W4DWL5_9ACTN|nr:hypothetical protein SCOCK_300061 [Actinacidiphila cocklensis]